MNLTEAQFQHILVVKLSAIGDVTMATPFARGLRDRYPDARIDWVVEPLSADVLRGNPFLNEIIVWERPRSKAGGIKGTLAFLGEIRDLRKRLHGQYDLAVDLQGLARSALVVRASGAPVRIGKADAREGGRFLLTHRLNLATLTFRAAAQYTEILSYLGHPSPPMALEIFPDDANRARADALLDTIPDKDQGIVAVAPATTRPYKHWTNEAWAASLDLLHEELGLIPVILGSQKDTTMSEEIIGLCRSARPQDFTGKTTLRDAAEIIRRSRLLAAVDTGLMHFGMAMQTPTVAIFGPTNAHRLRDEPLVRVMQAAGPRRFDNRVRKRAWWDDRSIDQNMPQDVLRGAADLLSSRTSAVAS